MKLARMEEQETHHHTSAKAVPMRSAELLSPGFFRPGGSSVRICQSRLC